MSYTTTKHQYSIDVLRTTDNHACGFMAKKMNFEGDEIDSSGNVTVFLPLANKDALIPANNPPAAAAA